MIDGLRVQMTTDELSHRIARRIAWHTQSAREYARELRLPERERTDPLLPDDVIEQEMMEHSDQAAVLTLLRDHLVPGEIYLLSEQDLQFADLAAGFQMTCSLPRRLAADVGDER